MKAREIILLFLIIAGGMILTQEKTGRVWPGWRAGDFLFFDGRSFTYEESRVVDGPLPAGLWIVNAHGEVTVEGAATDRLTLTLKKTIRRRTEEEARAVAAGLHPTVSSDGRALLIGTNRADFDRQQFSTDLWLTVPSGLAVEVENSYGTVKLGRLAGAAVVNRHGAVEISGLDGPVRVENSYEDVTIDGTLGSCEIKSSHSDVLARRVGGGLNLDHGYGTITLREIGGEVVVEGTHSEIIAEDVPGSLDLRNSYEPVTLRRVGRVKLTGHHTDVEAVEVGGGLEVTTEYGFISASAVRGGLRVNGKSVGLTAGDVTGGDIQVSTSYEPVTLNGFSGPARLLVSHGDISLSPSPLTGSLEVRGEYAGISLRWPDGGPYPIEARTRSGKIGWRPATPAEVRDQGGTTELEAYSEVLDKPGISLVTSYADIEIEED